MEIEINSSVVRLPLAVVFTKEEETFTSEDTVTPVGTLLIKFETFVTPVELVMRHFFHSKLRHNYAGRHSLSHIGANEATPCQNDIPFGNNSLFPIVKCRP